MIRTVSVTNCLYILLISFLHASVTSLLYVVYDADFTLNTGFNATFQIQPLNEHPEVCADAQVWCNTSHSSCNYSHQNESASGAVVWQERPVCENQTWLNHNQSPKALFGHSIVANDGALWLFGGYGQNGVSSGLWRYDIVSKRWTLKERSNSAGPAPRYMHSSVLASNRMLLYGGMFENGTTLNDLWEYRFENTSVVSGWQKVRSNLALPDVAGHTLTLCSDVVVLVGGISSQGGFNFDVWMFNISTNLWRKAPLQSCRFGFYGQSANYDPISGLLYIYGGLTHPVALLNRQMYSYNISTGVWQTVLPRYPFGPLFAPPLRYFHSTAPYQNGNETGFLLIGGKLTSNQYSDEIWLFRYTCRLWVRLSSRGSRDSIGAATAVAGISTGADDSQLYFLYGGYNHGVMLDRLQTFRISSLCKAANSVCECANLAAGCSPCPSMDVKDDERCLTPDPSSPCVALNYAHHPNYLIPTSCSTDAPFSTSDQGCGPRSFKEEYCAPLWCSTAQSCDDLLDFLDLQHQVHCRWCNVLRSYVCLRDNGYCTLSDVCQECFIPNLNQYSYSSNSGASFFENSGRSHPLFSLLEFKKFIFSGGLNHPKQQIVCSEFRNCTSCLSLNSLFKISGSSADCFWSTAFRKCVGSQLLDLACLGGQCGRIIRNSANSCPPNSCGNIAYCHNCLERPDCGWLAYEGQNGLGLCVEGNMHGPFDATNAVGSWEYLTCPLEDECVNGHHKCFPPFPDVCKDTEHGFECVCQDNYLLSTNKSYCIPVCKPPCINGHCVRPNECECDFHFTGERCDLACNCNGHSKCWSPNEIDQFQICTDCMNSTTGNHCQFCKKNFVGDPRNGGQCRPCEEICNGRSHYCSWNPDSHYVKFISPSEYGPLNSSVAICTQCTRHSEGRLCEACIDGYFEYKGICHKCTCNGHDDVCNKQTGLCNCKNNTVTAHEIDCFLTPNPILCLREQCNACKRDYIGFPSDGGLCYEMFDVGKSHCFQSPNVGCSSPLPPERASFFVLHPTFTNVELRLIIDVAVGEIDVYFTHKLNFFEIKTNSRTGRQTVTWGEKNRSPPNVPLKSPNNRRKRENFPFVSVYSPLKVTFVSASGPYQLISWSGQALRVEGVRNRLVILCSPYDYRLNITRFYVILHARKSSSSSLATSYERDVTRGASGQVIVRQDLNSLNLFVFFTVFFSCFFLFLSILIVAWKIKGTVSTQQAILARHIQMQHMASRPFASVYLNFSSQSFASSKPLGSKKMSDVSSEKTFAHASRLLNSSRDSEIFEHQIPLLHTTGDFLTVVTPKNHPHPDGSDLCPPDLFIPRASAGKVVVVPETFYQSNSPRSKNLPDAYLSRSVSIPSLSKHPSCSYSHSPSRSAPSSSFNQTKFYKNDNIADPVALERTGNLQAAVATFVLQLPGVSGQQCPMCLGSALISTRHLTSTLLRNESPITKRRKFVTTKLL